MQGTPPSPGLSSSPCLPACPHCPFVLRHASDFSGPRLRPAPGTTRTSTHTSRPFLDLERSIYTDGTLVPRLPTLLHCSLRLAAKHSWYSGTWWVDGFGDAGPSPPLPLFPAAHYNHSLVVCRRIITRAVQHGGPARRTPCFRPLHSCQAGGRNRCEAKPD